MVTLGNEDRGYLYTYYFDGSLHEILIYDDFTCEWYDVKEFLASNYPKQYEKHKMKSDVLYAAHLLAEPDCMDLAKADAERKLEG
jgi:hypothetical protein